MTKAWLVYTADCYAGDRVLCAACGEKGTRVTA